MKTLISRKDLRDTTSGVPKKVLQELLFFKQIGHEPYAIAETMNSEMVKEFGGIPVKTIKWPVSGFYRRKFYQYQVSRWIKKNRPDLVIGHGDILDQDVLFIHNCVHLAHELIEGKDLPSDHEVGRIHEEILKRGSYKLLICNSQMMKDDLVKRFKLDVVKAVVIYPEVNLSKFRVDDPVRVREEWRQKLGFAMDDLILGMVTSGNFKKRNLKNLILAFAELSKRHEKLKLFVAGGHIDQAFRDQVASLGITQKVIFAGPIIDVKNYYYLLDIFVLPAFIEEFGRSVLEAMFCGKTVIATKTVGAAEIFQGSSREFIMDQPTVESIVGLADKLIQNEELRKLVAEQNQATAIKYSADLQSAAFGETLKRFGIL